MIRLFPLSPNTSMFTIQLPWLPEFVIRLHDYQAIYASFQGKKMVSDNCMDVHTSIHTHTHTHTHAQAHRHIHISNSVTGYSRTHQKLSITI